MSFQNGEKKEWAGVVGLEVIAGGHRDDTALLLGGGDHVAELEDHLALELCLLPGEVLLDAAVVENLVLVVELLGGDGCLEHRDSVPVEKWVAVFCVYGIVMVI